MLDRIEDASDLRDIHEAKSEPLYDQKEAEEKPSHSFGNQNMTPFGRKNLPTSGHTGNG